MDGLISLVIFVGIIVASLVKKFQDQQKDDEQERESRPTSQADDLPEATRRQLYGNTAEVPRAKPRGEPRPQGGGSRQVPQPARRVSPMDQIKEVLKEAQRSMTEDAPVPKPRPKPAQRQAQTTRRVVQQSEAPVRQKVSVPATVAAPKQAATAVQQTKQKRARGTSVRQTQRTRKQSKAVAARKGRLFASPEDVRKGIVLREILGPPKALQ